MKKILIALIFLFLLSKTSFADLTYPPYGNEDWDKETVGNHKVLVVIVNFNDFKNLTNIEKIREKLNLFHDFYFNNSYGKLNLSFEIKFINLSKDMAYYGEDGGFENTSWKRIDELGYKYHHYGEDFSYQNVFANEVIEELNKNKINFSNYNHIIFIHSYYDQASMPNCKDCLWSIYMPYINNDMVNFGILISEDDSYGILVHEFGHELGLPDLYNIETGESVVGIYDVMDKGAWFNENFGAFSKYKLKFSNPIEINETNNSFVLNLSNFHNSFLKINVDNWTYFLIEYRKMNYNGTKYFLIWEVKEDLANNTDLNNLMVNVSVFTENGTFKKYNTTINFLLFENFSVINISNKFYQRNISRVINVEFCTFYESGYWPEGKEQNFSWCEDERKYKNFLNNETLNILAKLNLNLGDNVSIILKNFENLTTDIKKFENLNVKRGNNYNYWNTFIDKIIASFDIKNLNGKYVVEIYVNDKKIYEENLTILNHNDMNINLTPKIKLNVKSHYYDDVTTLFVENLNGNLSEILIDYWNKKFCNISLGKCQKKYDLNLEKIKLLNENKNISLNFYGNFHNKYCFQVFAKNAFQNLNNTEIFCTKICKSELKLAMKILENTILNNNLNINDNICYDFNFDDNIDIFDTSELLENLSLEN